MSCTSSCCALRISVSKSSGLSWSVSLSVVLRPQKKVGGSWRLLAFSSSSGVGFFSHTTWQSNSEYKRHKVCVKLKANKENFGQVDDSESKSPSRFNGLLANKLELHDATLSQKPVRLLGKIYELAVSNTLKVLSSQITFAKSGNSNNNNCDHDGPNICRKPLQTHK